jgi:hypothetical protein
MVNVLCIRVSVVKLYIVMLNDYVNVCSHGQSVTFLLSDVMLNIVMLNVIIFKFVVKFVVTVSVLWIRLIAVMLNIVTLIVIVSVSSRVDCIMHMAECQYT